MTEQDAILFENYLLGELSKEEHKSFDKQLQDEPAFNKKFNIYKELVGFLEHRFGNNEASEIFKNNLKNISNTYFKEKVIAKKKAAFKPWQYAIAASFVIFVATFTYTMLSTPSYADFSNYNAISLSIRGTQSEVLHNAEKAFNNRDFTEAETYFTQLLETTPNNIELQMYKAVSEIELNKFDKSDARLVKISQGNSAYRNKVLWYLALSKLKQKDTKACIVVLKRIPEDADDYKMAQKLLRKLK